MKKGTDMKTIVLFLLTLTVAQTPLRAQLPTITQSPTNQVLPMGATLSLSVTANGGTPLAYQWFKDNRLLVSATNSALTVANAGVTNSGMYSVVITNQPARLSSGGQSLPVRLGRQLVWRVGRRHGIQQLYMASLCGKQCGGGGSRSRSFAIFNDG
jgi:Immunoglobulin domain